MKVVCLDLETTGLDAERGLLLEAAVVLFDLAAMKEICRHEWLARTNVDHLAEQYEHCADVVRDMHTTNGLWDASIEATATGTLPEDIDRELVGILAKQGFVQAPLLGFNPDFDRRWMQQWLPQAEKLLHYRNLDLNALHILGGAWGVMPWIKPESKSLLHRAMADCDRVIAHVRSIRGWTRE